MANSTLKTESLELLIKAVQTYQEEIVTNYKILENAANACDVAMGNDDIAKKYISRLNVALSQLKKTADIAEEVFQALRREMQKAIDVYED